MAKILFITSRFPYPLNKGDKLRVYYQLKHLSLEHEVHLVAIEERVMQETEVHPVSSFCKSMHVFVLPLYKRIFQLIISRFKKLPLQVAFFYNQGIQKKIKKIIEEVKPDYIHCHLIRTTEYIKDIRHIPLSLDFMDAFGAGMEKRERYETNLLKKTLFAYEKKLLYNYEKQVFDFINRVSIISQQDKELIKTNKIHEINVIPNGVDFELFYPKEKEKRYDMVFMGNLSYPPNIEAILFLAAEIMPLVMKQIPDIKLLVAGIHPPKTIRQLQSKNIDIIEKFEDISESIAISKIMLAPMKISIGLQNKILQAMAMKVPCIVSSLSNNAILAPNNNAVLEANTAAEFTDAIIMLLGNEKKAAAIGEAGHEFVKTNYTWSKQNKLLIDLIVNRHF